MIPYRKNIPYRYRCMYDLFQVTDHFLGRKLGFPLTRSLRKWTYEGMEKRMKEGEKGRILEVDRRKDLSLEEFQKEYLEKNRPVVFEGLATDWDCTKKWSLDFLKNEYGNDNIIVIDQDNGSLPIEELTLKELINGIDGGLSRYYRFYPLIQRHPELLADIDFKWMKQHRHKRLAYDAFQAFIGPDNSYTPLHNANPANLFTQVYGVKEWVLYPNEFISIVDPLPVRSNYRSAPVKKEYGPFNPFDPDYSKPYHLYEYIDQYRTTLHPGDVLYNPPYWWHAIKNIGHTIGLGYRWLPLGHNFRHYPLNSALDLCTSRPPFWKTWRLSQIDPNLTHMAEIGKLKEYLKSKEGEK